MLKVECWFFFWRRDFFIGVAVRFQRFVEHILNIELRFLIFVFNPLGRFSRVNLVVGNETGMGII